MQPAARETRVASQRTSPRAFVGVAALLFAASVAATIGWRDSMSAVCAAAPAGGMSIASVRPMPGQTWAGAAASFLGMWTVMMVAMMLPSLLPALWRYHQALGCVRGTRPARETALVAAGYFAAWSLVGSSAFALGVVPETVGMPPWTSGLVPGAAGALVLAAGALQFSAWKARHLSFCRETPRGGDALPADPGAAWRHGLHLGLHCCCSCAGPTAILLVVGVMDLRAMAAIGAAVTLERIAPRGERMARLVGSFAVAVGLLWIARATGLA